MNKVISIILIILYSSLISCVCFLFVPMLILMVESKAAEAGGVFSILALPIMLGLAFLYALISNPIMWLVKRFRFPGEKTAMSWVFTIICAVIAGAPTTVRLIYNQSSLGSDAFTRMGYIFFGGILLSLWTGFMISSGIETNRKKS